MAGAALFLSGYSLGRQAATTPGTPGDEQAAFVPFWDAYRAITEQYAGGDVDRKTVIEGAIRGMIESLGDPFSSYLSSEDYRQEPPGHRRPVRGHRRRHRRPRRPTALAAQCTPLGPDCQMVVIVKPIEGAPADKAGIKAGDVVTEIDGAERGRPLGRRCRRQGARSKGHHRDPDRRPRGEAPQKISIVRDVIAEKEVISHSLAGGDGRLHQAHRLQRQLVERLREGLADDVKAGQRKIVLDLRGNPGGFVTAARSIASQFIGVGPDLLAGGRRGQPGRRPWRTSGGSATDTGIQVVVLIDKGSASASEIVAGALQDTKRATLVGETSYGKGTIQEWQPLPERHRRLPAHDREVADARQALDPREGLAPDVAVEVPQSTPPDKDPVLDKALEMLGSTTALALPAAA